MDILWQYTTKNYVHRICDEDDENYTYSNGVGHRANKKTGVITEVNTGVKYSPTLDGVMRIACKHVTNEKQCGSLRKYIDEYRALLEDLATGI